MSHAYIDTWIDLDYSSTMEDSRYVIGPELAALIWSIVSYRILPHDKIWRKQYFIFKSWCYFNEIILG